MWPVGELTTNVVSGALLIREAHGFALERSENLFIKMLTICVHRPLFLPIFNIGLNTSENLSTLKK